METRERIWPDIAIPPGELLAETLEAVGMSQAELARRTGRPAQAINEIVQGKKEITPETALQFEKVLGTPAHVWVGLEADYRFLKAKIDEQEKLGDEAGLAAAFPFKEMADHGWVRSVKKAADCVGELHRFFGVASLRHVQLPNAAWRRAKKVEPSQHALAAWLREGERQAQRAEAADYDPEALTGLLTRLRSLTLAEDFGAKLQLWLAECGVVAVFVPGLKRTGAHGATRWLGKHPVMQLSIYYRWLDVFWFTVFHEIGHILRHGRQMFIEYDNGAGNQAEEESDQFAASQLIPPTEYSRFLRAVRRPMSESAVRAFADRVGVHPAVIVGRLQHEGELPRTHLNGLRPRLAWRA